MISKVKKIFIALTPLEQTLFLLALGVTLIAGVAVAGMVVNQSTKVVPAQGGEFIEGIVGQPIYINPVLASNDADKSLVRLLFENVRDLATKIEPDPTKENRIWRIRLKEGLLWQDGEKLTSDDVIFTIQKIQNPETKSPLAGSWQGVAANRLSELEIQLTTAAPYAFLPSTLENLYVIPKHIFAEVPAPNWRLSDYNLKPVGSGPYLFYSLEKNREGFIESYVLRSSDTHAGEKPHIPRIRVKFFTKLDEAIQSFNAGQIDGLAGMNVEDIRNVKRPNKLLSYELPNYYAVFLNQSKNPILKEAAVREALADAVDARALATEIFKEYALPLEGPLRLEVATRTDDAGAILEKAGWKINADGIREKAANKSTSSLALTLTVPRVPFLLTTAQSLQNSWHKAGFAITIKDAPPEEILAHDIKNRDYDMILFGNVFGINKDLFSFWHSTQRFYPGLNLSLYNNKKADDLIETIREDFNPESRDAGRENLENILIDDHPAVFLYSPRFLYLVSKNLEGVNTNPIADPADRFRTVETWYTETARILK